MSTESYSATAVVEPGSEERAATAVVEPGSEENDDHEDHAEFLGLFVQRGDVVRTNDGEEEYVYDPAAYPEDSD